MTSWRPFSEQIRLFVPERITQADAERQTDTAREILLRLAEQPGLVLADEVGMGKTFVALAAATSVALADSNRRPVVVMVPAGLREKWPSDFAVFREQCLDASVRDRVRCGSAETAVELLKLLDDPPERRCAIIFLTHGAMHRGLTDGWVKLAVIQRAIKGRHHTAKTRTALTRCMGSLLRMGWARQDEGFWGRLLGTPPRDWLRTIDRLGVTHLLLRKLRSRHDAEEADLHADSLDGGRVVVEPAPDDPVPEAVIAALQELSSNECDDLYEHLQRIPKHQSETYEDRVATARNSLKESL